MSLLVEGVMKKGQVSIEYLMLFGFILLILSTLLITSIFYTRDVEDSVVLNQVDAIAREITTTADSIYYYGAPSKTTIVAFMPKQIRNVSINQNDLTFTVWTRSGITDVFKKSSVPMQGSIDIQPGFHDITVEAREGYVWLNST